MIFALYLWHPYELQAFLIGVVVGALSVRSITLLLLHRYLKDRQ